MAVEPENRHNFMDIKEFIEQNYGEIEKMDADRRDEVFVEIYKDLSLTIERDFGYMQKVMRITVQKNVPEKL